MFANGYVRKFRKQCIISYINSPLFLCRSQNLSKSYLNCIFKMIFRISYGCLCYLKVLINMHYDCKADYLKSFFNRTVHSDKASHIGLFFCIIYCITSPVIADQCLIPNPFIFVVHFNCKNISSYVLIKSHLYRNSWFLRYEIYFIGGCCVLLLIFSKLTLHVLASKSKNFILLHRKPPRI